MWELNYADSNYCSKLFYDIFTYANKLDGLRRTFIVGSK